MKAKHHFWSSLAAGGAAYWATGSIAALTGSMIGGFVIDADHVIDQMWSIRHGAPFRRKDEGRKIGESTRMEWLANLLRPRRLVRLPLVLHSYELLVLFAVLTLLLRTPFLIGLLAGYVLHLVLDIVRHHHEFRSPLFYLLAYRLTQRFRRDRLIRTEYL